MMLIELTQAIVSPRLRFSEKNDHPFPHVFIFGNLFPESHSFVAMPVISLNNFVSFQFLDNDKLEHVSLKQLVTGIATKPQLSGIILPNINHAKMEGRISQKI